MLSYGELMFELSKILLTFFLVKFIFEAIKAVDELITLMMRIFRG